ncbi:MAG: hypothetical protein GWN47_03160 [Woeseiaceae bacterium]|nr:hypothetical protein [Woeseiaceae bacterium]
MDTAWIQVFVLTLAECVAPAGKTVCQEQQLELLFFSESDCQVALEQLISLKEESEYVIVDHAASRCAPSARQTDAFASLEAINEAYKDKTGWHIPGEDDGQSAVSHAAHQDRLAELKTCEETRGVTPCKIGEIIIEEGTAGDSVDVWRRDQ